jgi:outer membrane protein OmpA-like peptidoglycan-associated protein
MMHTLSYTLRRLGPVLALGFVLAGCHSSGSSISINSDSDGYKALVAGDYAKSRSEFEPMLAKTSHDPYVELDLAVAYQGLGRMDLAEPLYRQAMIDGKDVHPAVAQFARDQGKSIAEVGCENIEIANHTNNCDVAPPPQPAMPPPVKNFIVFFDFNRSDLTGEAQSIVAEAIKAAKTQGAAHITVTGHTDTVGSDRYNEALAMRRASAVKDALVAGGIDAAGISTDGRGFHDLLVQTGPGVREPRNRRAVIDLGGQ